MRSCIFCRAWRLSRDEKSLVLERTRDSFSLLNLYPYNTGHVMIVPRRHVKDFDRLSAPEREGLLNLFTKTKKRVEKVLKPHGFNAGINFERASGAGVAGHLHIHLVPRWVGDTNFMPILAETKVISESLRTVYRRLQGRAGTKR
jgi:ATP adenylyltransferase